MDVFYVPSHAIGITHETAHKADTLQMSVPGFQMSVVGSREFTGTSVGWIDGNADAQMLRRAKHLSHGVAEPLGNEGAQVEKRQFIG